MGKGLEDRQCGLRGQAGSVGGPWRVLSRGCCDGFAFGKPALWLPGGDGWEGTREVQEHAWCLTGEEGMEESGGGQPLSCRSAWRGVQAIQMGATQDPRGVHEVNERMWLRGGCRAGHQHELGSRWPSHLVMQPRAPAAGDRVALRPIWILCGYAPATSLRPPLHPAGRCGQEDTPWSCFTQVLRLLNYLFLDITLQGAIPLPPSLGSGLGVHCLGQALGTGNLPEVKRCVLTRVCARVLSGV